MIKTAYPILVTAPRHWQKCLERELNALGFCQLRKEAAGFLLAGTLRDAMRLNLWLRTAHHVMLRLKEFTCRDAEELYQQLKSIPWEEYIVETGYFSVFSNVSNPTINDTRFPNLKTKDAVADRILAACGRRPDSGPNRDRTMVYLYWKNDYACVYLDTSGETLSKRGWRTTGLEAPLQEALAAGLILTSKWDPATNFVNPMCGSGTLAIEALLIALNRPAGLTRKNFAFMHIKNYDPEIWDELKQTAGKQIKKSPSTRFIATDKSPAAIDATAKNAAAAGVADLIELKICDFRQTPMPGSSGTLIVNPEYGKRLGDEKQLSEVYRELGNFFKKTQRGYSCWLFSGNLNLIKQIGLTPAKELTFYNGDIECRFNEYKGMHQSI
jgi:23S rRNA G2445 N2-methylase RlmL